MRLGPAVSVAICLVVATDLEGLMTEDGDLLTTEDGGLDLDA